jgi:hypothetical protein
MQFGNRTFVLYVDAVGTLCIIVPTYSFMLKQGGHRERDDERKHKHPQQHHNTPSSIIIYGIVPTSHEVFTTDDEATMSEDTRTRRSFTHPPRRCIYIVCGR